MTKKQKSISVPIEYWNQLEESYEKYKNELLIWGIDSPSELLRVLGNIGLQRIQEIVESLRMSRMKITESREKT